MKMEHKYIGDVPYITQTTRKGKRELLMDFALPDSKVWPGPWPVILISHGGTWAGWRLQEDIPWNYVDEHGFALARFDYRTAYDAPFPAQVADCRSAVRFVRQHAAEYNIDPCRIGVRGNSAGGHLAAMLGVGDGAEGIDNPTDDLSVSVAVQAVVDNYGPTNILQLWRLLDKVYRCIGSFGAERERLMKSLLEDPDTERHYIRSLMNGPLKWLSAVPGTQYLIYIRSPNNLIGIARYLADGGALSSSILKDEEMLRMVSPIEYVVGVHRKDGRKVPPFRILHGEEDSFVPFAQSKVFVEALRKIGADVTFDTDCGGGGHFPSWDHWRNVIAPKEVEFFKRTIGKRK